LGRESKMKKSMQWSVAFLSMALLVLGAGNSNASVLALDDFSGGDFGWGTNVWAQSGQATVFTTSTANPFPDGVGSDYVTYTQNPDTSTQSYPDRDLATAFNPSTTPDVWAAIYLRPLVADPGWQYGFELKPNAASITNGVQVGFHNAGLTVHVSGSNYKDAANTSGSFVVSNANLLVVHLYTSDGNYYDTADVYLDNNVTTRSTGSLTQIYSGYDLGAGGSDDRLTSFQNFRMQNQTPGGIDFDYVAVGTTMADVVIIPEPTTFSLIVVGGVLAFLAFIRRRKVASNPF